MGFFAACSDRRDKFDLRRILDEDSGPALLLASPLRGSLPLFIAGVAGRLATRRSREARRRALCDCADRRGPLRGSFGGSNSVLIIRIVRIITFFELREGVIVIVAAVIARVGVAPASTGGSQKGGVDGP